MFLDLILGIMVKSPKLLVLDDFIFHALEIESIYAQEFMASKPTTGLHRSFQPQLMDLLFALKCRVCALKIEDTTVSHSPWSDHCFVKLYHNLCWGGPVWIIDPWCLMDHGGFLKAPDILRDLAGTSFMCLIDLRYKVILKFPFSLQFQL